jgi:hypothetical protein
MSERPDPQDPDRDPALDRAYREFARDEPPARLDDAIRAAARREVGARPQPAGGGGLRAWRVPVSIAAMLVVGVSLVTLVREEHPQVLEIPPPAPSASTAHTEAEQARPKAFEETARVKNDAARDAAPAKDAAAAAPTGKLATASAEVPAQAGSGAPAGQDEKSRPEAKRERRDQADVTGSVAGNVAAPAQEPQRQVPQAFGAPETRAAEVPAPAVAAVPAAKPDLAPAADSLAQAAPRPAPPPPAMKPAPSPAPKPMAKPVPRSEIQAPSAPAAEPPADVRMTQPAPPLAKAQVEGDYAGLDTPDKWLARIRELRKQGRLTEAAKVLAEFRQRHPAYALPPDLVEGIKP